MAKVRVFALAKELGLKTSALIKALGHMGVGNLTTASAIDEETATAVRQLVAEQIAKARERAQEASGQKPAEKEAEAVAPAAKAEDMAPEDVEPVIAETVAVEVPKTAATEKKQKPETDSDDERKSEEGLQHLQSEMARRDFSAHHPGSYSSIEEIEERYAAQAGEPEEEEADPDKVTPLPELAARQSGEERPSTAIAVPPVVTVLGHVDHGKTSLLDALRSTDVVAGESGGITQHIGASELQVGDKSIVFIDTPGHEAFTAIRARGAQITDIAVLIIAADDGIMPQTVEAISHAKAANVPIIVAINKIDLPGANPERVKQQLLEHQLVPEEWGGDTIVCEISAETHEGLDNLVDMILLVAELQEYWADPTQSFVGVVVEAGVAPTQGPVATILTRRGELKVGDTLVAGEFYGRIRRLNDWRGKSIKSVSPGRPVEVIGINGAPDAGEIVISAASPKEARSIAEARAEANRQHAFETSRAAALRELFAGMRSGEVKNLNFIIKADVFGSAQALEAKLHTLDDRLNEIDIDIIHSGVGPVNESDIMLAKASEAIILGFNVTAPATVLQTAEVEGIEIRLYTIIYEAIEDIVAAASGLLEPVTEERKIGEAEVLQLFSSSKAGMVAGCRCTDGRLVPRAIMRVYRGKEMIYQGQLTSLRYIDRDVSEIQAPSECGIATPNFRRWQIGDRIEAFVEVKIERRVTMEGGEHRVDGRR